MSDHNALSGCRILVVEDNYLQAADTCDWLRQAGAEIVGPTGDSNEARRLIEQEHVDRAVIDINLGAGPVYDVAVTLEERKVPFLFATGYDEQILPPRFKSVPRVEKPFHGPGLVRAVSALN